MEQKNTNKQDKEVIAKLERWFNVLHWLPLITTIVLAVACFVCGIAFAVGFDEASFLPIFWFGGPVACLILYVLLKIVTAYPILHIHYLKEIYANSGKVSNEEKEEVLPEI